MKRKSVALFLPYLIVGGIERLYITYANHLARIYDVTLIVCSTEGEYASDINPEVSIVSLDGARIRSSLFRLIKVLRKYRFDLVMGSNMLSNIILILASFFCKKTKTPSEQKAIRRCVEVFKLWSIADCEFYGFF